MSNQAGLGIGDAVHTEEINEYPEEMRSDYLRLSNWARATADRYGGRVIVRLIDVQSPVGLWKALRNGIRRYPGWIVDGQEKVVGWDEEAVEAAIQRRLTAAA